MCVSGFDGEIDWQSAAGLVEVDCWLCPRNSPFLQRNRLWIWWNGAKYSLFINGETFNWEVGFASFADTIIWARVRSCACRISVQRCVYHGVRRVTSRVISPSMVKLISLTICGGLVVVDIVSLECNRVGNTKNNCWIALEGAPIVVGHWPFSTHHWVFIRWVF